MSVEPGKVYIRKVRVLRREGKELAPFLIAPRSEDTPALQRRLAGSLSHPPGLPAAAILCVRKLHSPLLGSRSSRAARSSHDWEQAVAGSLRQLAGQAARPTRGEVPAHAEAVLFADRSEMLACLANDYCQGKAGGHWWWKSLFREQELSQAIVSAWLAQPEYIPAALHHLTGMGQALPFLQSLRDVDVQSMVRGVIYHFALYELQPLMAQTRQGAFHLSHTGSWQKWAPESTDERLQLEQQWLLAIGLTLMRVPAVAHSSSFARDVLRGWGAEDDPNAAASALVADEQATGEVLEAEIDIELGGLFYLVNLGLFLELYSDFTTPLQPGIALSIWDFITLLGQELNGQEGQADPVWQLLAQLAGRSVEDLPGRDFMPPDSWRVPVEWLRPFTGEGPWHWAARHGRLQIWHPAPFLVLDVALEGADPRVQLDAELQAYQPVEIVPGAQPLPQTRHGETQLGRWLSWLMPYVRARLQRALGLTNADEIADVLCRHHAHLSLTATHLDLVLSLGSLPIAVRLSALDRNPGWVPAAGRYITFYFE